MREEWTEKMKQKLSGHRKAAPAGLWEGISKQMEASPIPSRGNRRWYWAAAAAVLALIGFFVFHDSNDNEQPMQANADSQQVTSQQATGTNAEEKEPPTTTPTIAITQKSKSSPTTKKQDETKQQEPTTSEETKQDDEKTMQEMPSAEEQRQEPLQRPVRHETGLEEWAATQSSKPSTNKWTVGVNTSGRLLAANTSQRMDRLEKFYETGWGHLTDIDLSSLPIKANESSNVTSSDGLTEFVSKHYLPIRFGLSLNYQLTPRLSLHSGISYTYLYSKFYITRYMYATHDQKLHYLGVPLGVSWQLWANRRFQVYVAGDVMLEKCLRYDTLIKHENEKPWQWSVNAAAGAEYSLSPQFGIYMEPSLGYYFDDGTSLEHYYKKHPWTPAIKLGLRLHLQ